jgi:ABC-type glycerol-3-phosphate transport system substrate-binding protein
MIKHLTRSALITSTLLLAACGGGGGGSSTGTVSIAVQDAPVDGADAVYITFSRIDLHSPDGTQSFVLDSDPLTADT